MAVSCRTWRNKSLERRAEVKLTSSLPVRSSCTTAHWSIKCPGYFPPHPIGANTSITSIHPTTEDLPCRRTPTPAAPPHQHPSSLLGPKDGTLHQILLRACLWVKPLQRLLWKDPPALRGKRFPLGSKHSSQAVLRHLAENLTW